MSSLRSSLSEKKLDKAIGEVTSAQRRVQKRWRGDGGARQPVHTVYGGAHLFTADTAAKLGQLALRALETFAPDPGPFAEAVGVPAELAGKIYERVQGKLRAEPVEDFRIDFEDGYGNRSDEEEDKHAAAAATEVARGMKQKTLPPFIGIRIKPLTADLARRSLRTLDIFVTTLIEAAGELPANFVVTLPKIMSKKDVEILVGILEALEDRLELPHRALRLEIMVETTQSIFDADGRAVLPRLHDAADGRLSGAHFGTYDYTANYEITAAYQKMGHGACDFAKHMMKLAFAGTEVLLSDGATNIMPVAPHKSPQNDDEKRQNREAVFAGWRLHADDVRHSLINGFYQGWDLHPAQLPTRYATLYAFFLAGLPAASDRLRNFMQKAAQATLAGDVFDDAATGQGLLNFFLRGLSAGAIREDEALATGLTLDELRTRSFVKILDGRKKK